MNAAAQPDAYSYFLQRRAWFWENRAKLKDHRGRNEMAVLTRLNPKMAGYDWAIANGVPSVGYRHFDTVEQAMASDLPDRFVLKPRSGHSSEGVYVLQRRGDGQFRCTMTGKMYADRAAIVQAFRKERRRKSKIIRTDEVILEDRIEDRQGFDIPLDYKVYAFHTGCPIVMQRYAPRHLPKSQWAFAFYDAQGRDLGLIRQKTADNARAVGLCPPDNLDDIFAAARTLVAQEPISFMRLDFYATPGGVAFGEVTGVPNNAKEAFCPEWEARLGAQWRDSIRALGLNYSRRNG